MCTVRPHIKTARVVGADVIARLRAGVVVLVVHLDASIIGARDGSDGRPARAIARILVFVAVVGGVDRSLGVCKKKKEEKKKKKKKKKH